MRIFKRLTKVSVACSLVILLLLVLGCSRQARQETLLIAGSSTMLPYMEKLEERFTKSHPGILIESDGGGSTAGLIAVRRNAIDMAMLSREVRANEDDQYTRDYLVGKDAVIIVVHPSNPLAGLSKDQLRDVFTGTIANWRQIGGSDAPIVVVGRKKGSTTRKGMEEMVISGLDFAKSAVNAESAAALTETVAGNRNAIGYLALKDVKNSVKALTVNGVAPSRETILSERYPLSRSFHLVIYDKPKSAAQKFLDFIIGKEGQAILEHEGLIKVN